MLAVLLRVLYNSPGMLTSTFVFLQGIGPATERRWWEQGFLSWQQFLDQPKIAGLSPQRKSWYDQELTLAQNQLTNGQWQLLASRLQGRDHWRLYPLCRSKIVYLDIETTGTSAGHGHVTVVGLHRDGQTTSLVHGQSLTTDRLQEELDQAELLVTFFGTGFDVPYLRAHFPRLRLTLPHFDLCFAARRLGLRGGLKQIERELGIERAPAIQGLDGWDAVRLWSRWNASGDHDALNLLLAYNAADADNLVPLAERVFGDMLERFGPPSVGSSVLRQAAPAEARL